MAKIIDTLRQRLQFFINVLLIVFFRQFIDAFVPIVVKLLLLFQSWDWLRVLDACLLFLESLFGFLFDSVEEGSVILGLLLVMILLVYAV